MSRLIPSYKKTSDNRYSGKVVAIENGRYLWSEHIPIVRLNKQDAIHDARVRIMDLFAWVRA
jgi:hypothetical protein